MCNRNRDLCLAATTTTVPMQNHAWALGPLYPCSVGNSRRLLYSYRWQGYPLYRHHLPSTCRLLTADRPSFLVDISSISDMSRSSSSTFQALLDAALQDYEDKTGSVLIDHPLAEELQECDSVMSVTTILEEQIRIFPSYEFTDHGMLVDSLKHLVDVLSSPFISNVFDQDTDLVVRPKGTPLCVLLLIVILQPLPPAKATFAGIAILLTVYTSSSDFTSP